jgi:hypothetical protein
MNHRSETAPAVLSGAETKCHDRGSGRHCPATFGTCAAGIYAFSHAAEALAICSALLADFCAFTADVLMVRRTNEHEVRGGAANFGTGRDQAEVRGSDVFAPHLQAVVEGALRASLVAGETRVNAGLHCGVIVMHLDSPQARRGAFRRPCFFISVH